MKRYAIYWAPPPGAFADFTARWLGWDAARGVEVAHPDLPGLPRPAAELTDTPRKYGFHGTIKAPFRLADGESVEALHAATQKLAASLGSVRMTGLRLTAMHGFLALLIDGDDAALNRLADRVVMDLDRFRAPPTADEIARRRPDQMSVRQRQMLDLWGYPLVMEEFQFHLTLTGHFSDAETQAARTALAPHIEPLMPVPFEVADLCLFGEADDGRFRILHRYTLGG